MNSDDIDANLEMYLRQILELGNLMVEGQNAAIPNLITLRDLAENALEIFYAKNKVKQT